MYIKIADLRCKALLKPVMEEFSSWIGDTKTSEAQAWEGSNFSLQRSTTSSLQTEHYQSIVHLIFQHVRRLPIILKAYCLMYLILDGWVGKTPDCNVQMPSCSTGIY